MLNREEIEAIYPDVKAIIADALVVDEEEVELDKRLIGDLGAESIDFLDIRFQIEDKFKVKIKRGDIEEKARKLLGDQKFETEEGRLTEAGLKVLKEILAEIPAAYFRADLKVSEIPTLFTVATFCRFVIEAKKEASKEAACC